MFVIGCLGVCSAKLSLIEAKTATIGVLSAILVFAYLVGLWQHHRESVDEAGEGTGSGFDNLRLAARNSRLQQKVMLLETQKVHMAHKLSMFEWDASTPSRRETRVEGGGEASGAYVEWSAMCDQHKRACQRGLFYTNRVDPNDDLVLTELFEVCKDLSAAWAAILILFLEESKATEFIEQILKKENLPSLKGSGIAVLQSINGFLTLLASEIGRAESTIGHDEVRTFTPSTPHKS